MLMRPAVHVRQGRAPAVVLGLAQRELWTDPAVLPVRVRASGGGAVLAGPWLLRAAVALPRDHKLASRGPAHAAAWMGEVHRCWLLGQGIPGAVVYNGPTLDHWACFAGRGPGEVLVDGRKITGIAQAWRKAGVLLSSGTLLARPPWELLCKAMRRPPGDADMLACSTTNIADILGRDADTLRWKASLQVALASALARH